MGFPSDPSALNVGIAFGADLSDDPTTLSYTNLEVTGDGDVMPVITITRGRIGDSTVTQPTTVDLTLKDPSGVFSPRNISSPAYGSLRKNTPIRVRVDPGSGFVTRGFGQVPDWSPKWVTPNDDKVRISAQGALTRLGQGRESMSAVKRSTRAARPDAYWPFEEDLGSGLTSTLPAVQSSNGTYEFTALTVPAPGTVGFLDARGGASVYGNIVTTPFSPTSWQLEWVVQFATDTVGGLVPIANINLQGGTLPSILAAAGDPLVQDGLPHHESFILTQSGPDVVQDKYIDGVFISTTTIGLGLTLGIPTSVVINPFNSTTDDLPLISHLAFFATPSLPTVRGAAYSGYDGETAADRVDRLCAEEGIPVDVAVATSQEMGPQLPGGIVELLRECEATDSGQLLERITGGLGFDPGSTRYNLTADLTLSYFQVADLDLADDDRDLLNDVTVSRPGGASGRSQQLTGPLSVDPATGADRYPRELQRSLHTDIQPVNQASWIRHLGTVDEPRYVLGLNLRQNTGLITQWLACDLGSRIVVTIPTGSPTTAPVIHTGPAPLDLILEGYVEVLDAVQWYVTLYTKPYLPYEVQQVQSGTGNRSRVPPADGETTTNVQRSATDTSIAITSTKVRWIDSATFGSQFPIDIVIAGEVMSCTALTGTGLGQTMTVVRGKHGVSKILPAGSTVQLWKAPVTAL